MKKKYVKAILRQCLKHKTHTMIIQKGLVDDVLSYLKNVLEYCAELTGEEFGTRTK